MSYYGGGDYVPPPHPPRWQQHGQFAPPEGPPPGWQPYSQQPEQYPHHHHYHHRPHGQYCPLPSGPSSEPFDPYSAPPPDGPPRPRRDPTGYPITSSFSATRNEDEYAPPAGPPPSRWQGDYNEYIPPPGPPPPGLGSYGYPLEGQQLYAAHPHFDPGEHAAPPVEEQHFGQGAPNGYTFKYSRCTGTRKALLIGINYFGQDGELRGCINDTKNLSEFLIEQYGYKHEYIVILTDDQQDPIHQPTRENILRAMQWLVSGAEPDDALFLHYSGHGGQTEDLDGDEDDGNDEVIYPVDFKATGHIIDDEIHALVVQPLKPGVRLTAIFDSCHSGTAMDLPYLYSTKGVLKEPNLAKEAGQGLLDAATAYVSGDMMGVANSVFGFAKSAWRGDDAHKRTIQTKTSPADVIMFSGSKDDQTSADATIASKATGAMSWAFTTALKKNPRPSYLQLLNDIRDILETEYSQKPQLSCSHPIDTSLLFVM